MLCSREACAAIKLRNETLIVCHTQLAEVLSILMGNKAETTRERVEDWIIMVFPSFCLFGLLQKKDEEDEETKDREEK